MNEGPRSEAGAIGQEFDRESRAEALLVEGLDHYLSGCYEDAIHVWTRVLFLDRNHQPARAYIERARTALGERQRRAEEMLHRTEELVGEGALERARTLLSEVGPSSGDDAHVARLWTNIERAERARTVTAAAGASSADAPALAPPLAEGGGGPVWAIARLVAAGAVGALLITLVTSPVARGWFGASPDLRGRALMRPPALEVLSGTDVALIRARSLYARGRLAEALGVLDRVSASSPERAAVDALRVEIQGLLLATATVTMATAKDGARP